MTMPASLRFRRKRASVLSALYSPPTPTPTPIAFYPLPLDSPSLALHSVFSWTDSDAHANVDDNFHSFLPLGTAKTLRSIASRISLRLSPAAASPRTPSYQSIRSPSFLVPESPRSIRSIRSRLSVQRLRPSVSLPTLSGTGTAPRSAKRPRTGAEPVTSLPSKQSTSSRPGSSSGPAGGVGAGWGSGNAAAGYAQQNSGGSSFAQQQQPRAYGDAMPSTAPLNYRPVRTAPQPPLASLSTSSGPLGGSGNYLDEADHRDMYDSPVEGSGSGSGSHHGHRTSFGAGGGATRPSYSTSATSGRPPIFPSGPSSSAAAGSSFQPSRPAPPLPHAAGSYSSSTSHTPTTSPGRYHSPLPSMTGNGNGSGDSLSQHDDGVYGYGGYGSGPARRQASNNSGAKLGSQPSLRDLSDALPPSSSVMGASSSSADAFGSTSSYGHHGARVATPSSSASSLVSTGGNGSNSNNQHAHSYSVVPQSYNLLTDPATAAAAGLSVGANHENGHADPATFAGYTPASGPYGGGGGGASNGPPQTPGPTSGYAGDSAQRWSGDKESQSSTPSTASSAAAAAAAAAASGGGGNGGSGYASGTVKEGKRSKGFGSFFGASRSANGSVCALRLWRC